MTSKPHVLIYRDFLLPRSETFIRSQAEGLSRFTPVYVGLRVVDGVSVPRDRTITIQGDGPLGRLESAAFSKLGIAPIALYKLRRLEPRLIHAHFGVDATRVLRLARALRVPLIATFHDYDVTTSDADLLKLAPYCAEYMRRRPQLDRQATAFLAVSKFIKRRALIKGFSEDKILVHYIGIDVDRFKPRAREERSPLVLFVGRLVAKKGCEYLVRAMIDVQAVRPDAELVVIGDGPLLGELKQLAAGCLQRYRFLGALSSDEVRSWHERATVFCLPSVTADSGETEGLPISILEALATGLPVVSTEHAGIPEAVIHDRTGLLAPERDARALGARILDVLSNSDFAHRIGAAGRELVEQSFDLKRQNARLEEIYQEVADHPSRVPTAS